MKVLKVFIPILIASGLLFSSCSSAPERPMKVTAISDATATRYETANAELGSGRYDLALLHLSQAYNMAFSVDDADLLCRVSLSGISYKIATGTLDATNPDSDSFISSLSAEEILADAKYFAERTSKSDILTSVCNIYSVEIELARGKKNHLLYEKTLLTSEEPLKKEPYYLALLYRVLGDVNIRLKKYDSAVSYYNNAAELHTKNRYLSEIGSDWYGVARANSLNGNKDAAILAMENALKYDRDAENTPAIASDYFACAKILMKGTVNLEDKKKAKSCAKWASAIYKAAGMKAESAACEEFLSGLK